MRRLRASNPTACIFLVRCDSVRCKLTREVFAFVIFGLYLETRQQDKKISNRIPHLTMRRHRCISCKGNVGFGRYCCLCLRVDLNRQTYSRWLPRCKKHAWMRWGLVRTKPTVAVTRTSRTLVTTRLVADAGDVTRCQRNKSSHSTSGRSRLQNSVECCISLKYAFHCSK